MQYKIYIDCTGYYTENKNGIENRKPLLAIRFFIRADIEKPSMIHGLSIDSQSHIDYEECSKDVGEKLNVWLDKKYPEDKLDAIDYLLKNEKMRQKFNRLKECKFESVKGCGLDHIEMNYIEKNNNYGRA